MIVRRKLTKNFTIMPNEIWDDVALTIEAKGALGYMLSRPDDWNVHLGALGRKLGLGKNKTQALVRQLMAAGYMVRLKQKPAGAQQFAKYDYIVFDAPETRSEFMAEKGLEEVRTTEVCPPVTIQHEPQPQIGATVISQENHCDISAAALVTGAPNQGRILRTDLTKPFREEVSAEAGAKAPSVNAQIWKEGRELLSQAPSPANSSIIGKWLKRVPTPEGKKKLRAMMRAAVEAGTADPAAYVTAALAKEFPPPPDVKTFDAAKWGWIVKAAIKTCDWSSAWGPPPGKKGCLMPAHLITTELTAALSARKIAA